MKALRGTGIAMVTPFLSDGQIDFEGLKKLTHHLITGGVEYLVVMGTTGESATLSKEEKLSVLQTVVTENAGRCKIVYGMGGNDTRALMQEMQQMDFSNVDAILSVSPYYNKPTQEGIYQHYKALAAVAPKPIILYNVPGRTGMNMSAETTLRLAHDFDNIIAIKEASGNMEQVMQIIKNRPKNFLVISGDDNLTYPIIALGGDGVISVSGHGYPKLFSDMVRNGLQGNFSAALPAHYQLFKFTQLIFQEGNPGGIKVALEALGVCGASVRLPLWPVSENLKATLLSEMQSIG
jgi:4-hydroxy-tetrahydrodipicolinate synthase